MSSDRSAWLDSWHFAGLPLLDAVPSALRWSPFWSLPASPSRCTNRSRPRLARCAAAAFALTGCLYASCLLTAEWHYTAAVSGDSLAHMTRAAAIFPLAARYRSAPAHLLSANRWDEQRIPAMIAIGQALDGDLYALDLRMNLAAALIEGGHLPQARQQMAIVHRLAPKASMAIKVMVPRDALPQPEPQTKVEP
jgi:hypothetical protein